MKQNSDDIDIEKLANENLNIFERAIARLDQVRFYVKAKYFPHSRERKVYENRRVTYATLFPDSPDRRLQWSKLSEMPHKFAVKKYGGVLGKYIFLTTGHIITAEEIDAAVYGEDEAYAGVIE